MAKRKTRTKATRRTGSQGLVRKVLRIAVRVGLVVVALGLLVMFLGRFVPPWTTPYMFAEGRKLGGVSYEWVALEDVAPVMARSVVAAEDANFCTHWGFDMVAIREAIEDGGTRGASTLSQQTVKNLYLWHGRNYTRKAAEALLTPVLEGLWPKRRIIEVYLNIAEFDTGVFGVKAAAAHYFGVSPDALSATQAARLAAILPSPKTRSASRPSDFVRKRARAIIDGAATIRRDGRAACFES
ncbi:monofunctional biosynthetic peptidoglycan transglycosylase [Roseobacter denitrificans]|uniref:monofunctional biosynthetic peptidoglycan transglycosylase n=1 Tax=Roseobacter denitrificans TaxID=2434 RepID=UPI000306A461|nr:monofunctional biosynthetic peptidoglycan transglycosylase [Roseobacter denitrificans]AVL53023.1 monofunctional biosynthetic peptidoglycan transglycosylase [Roseobacter denitrificans]SFG26923.1 monofunctional biosynthetic peptidoglycan transglycosylase [Roseobacter denitrificans OCh 114]